MSKETKEATKVAVEGSTGEEVNTTFEQEAAAKSQLERANREKQIAEQIQDVLELAGYALQPFLSFTEYGIIPRVRMVPNPEAEVNKKENGDTKENKGDSEQSESTESS